MSILLMVYHAGENIGADWEEEDCGDDCCSLRMVGMNGRRTSFHHDRPGIALHEADNRPRMDRGRTCGQT